MLRVIFLTVIGLLAQQALAEEPERVVGGQTTRPGEFPYQCSLNYNGNHICGCSLIGPSHVLTAAHCLQGIVPPPYTWIRIVTGSITMNQGRSHNVRSVVLHPSYTPSQSWVNDIAVITLASPISFDAQTAAIPLASSAPTVGNQCVLTGWGKTSTNGPLSRTLLKMNTAITSSQRCQSIHQRTIYQSQVCAFTRTGIGACQGDSGGPLVCNGQQVGITSWVRPCAVGAPDVYTSVYHHRQFIQKSMY